MRDGSEGVGAGKLALPLAWTVLKSSPSSGCWERQQHRSTDGLTNSATNQAQIQGFELTHSKICINCELLDQRERVSHADPKLQDLHDTRQQQNSQEESRSGSSIDDVTKVGDREPDQ